MNKLFNGKNIAVMQIAAGAVMISFSPVFVNIANVGSCAAGFYRMLFGGLFLISFLLFKGGQLWQGRKHFLLVLFCSAVFTTDLVLWHKSIYYTGPALATLLSGFQVFFLVIFDLIILRKKITPVFIVAVILAMLGLYLIVGIDWHTLSHYYKKGVFFGLITALCYATYVILLGKTAFKSHPLSTENISTLTFITLLNLCFMFVAGFLLKESFSIPDSQSVAALLGYGIVSQFLAWIFIGAALPNISLSKAGLILLLQPVLAFVWDLLFFARPTPPEEFIGFIMAMAGIYLGTARHDAARQ